MIREFIAIWLVTLGYFIMPRESRDIFIAGIVEAHIKKEWFS